LLYPFNYRGLNAQLIIADIKTKHNVKKELKISVKTDILPLLLLIQKVWCCKIHMYLEYFNCGGFL